MSLAKFVNEAEVKALFVVSAGRVRCFLQRRFQMEDQGISPALDCLLFREHQRPEELGLSYLAC